MNDLRSAFELSSIEYHMKAPTPAKAENDAKIAGCLAEGRFVVVHMSLVHCPFTDAVIDSEQWYSVDFATYAEAVAHIDSTLDEYCCEGCVILVPEGFVCPIREVHQ